MAALDSKFSYWCWWSAAEFPNFKPFIALWDFSTSEIKEKKLSQQVLKYYRVPLARSPCCFPWEEQGTAPTPPHRAAAPCGKVWSALGFASSSSILGAQLWPDNRTFWRVLWKDQVKTETDFELCQKQKLDIHSNPLPYLFAPLLSQSPWERTAETTGSKWEEGIEHSCAASTRRIHPGWEMRTKSRRWLICQDDFQIIATFKEEKRAALKRDSDKSDVKNKTIRAEECYDNETSGEKKKENSLTRTS